MPADSVDDLAQTLLRVRRRLAAESPHSPAWAATREWVDDLEGQIRAQGTDPEAVIEKRLRAVDTRSP